MIRKFLVLGLFSIFSTILLINADSIQYSEAELNVSTESFQKISNTEGNFGGTLNNSDFFGYSIANLGDLNGDGVNDLAVGAPLHTFLGEKTPYFVNQYTGWGFLNIDIIDEGKILIGKFYTNDGSVLDQFGIVK